MVNYLKALLPDKRNDVLFAGYQAEGTLGQDIQSGAKEVGIDDEIINVQAQVHTMSGYSAHADQGDLLNFVEGIPVAPKEIHLIHGEGKAKHELHHLLTALDHHVLA